MRIEFDGPIAVLRGSLSKSSEYYYKVQNGKNIMARKPRRTKKSEAYKQSAKAKSSQEHFKQLSLMAQEVLHTNLLRARYEREWKKQKKYSTLRGYVMHCLAQTKQ